MLKTNKKAMNNAIALRLCVLACLFFTQAPAKAEASQKLAIIYTGQTHAALYPCRCPKSPEGGVARRATALRDMRKKHAHLLVLDAGGFLAGGFFDEYSQNEDLDKLRSSVNVRAMGLMGYDAVAITQEEFNFGYDFLKKSVLDTGPYFVCSNIKMPGAQEYIVNEIGGLKVVVLALANMPAPRKLPKDARILDPVAAAAKTVAELKKQGACLIVVLGGLEKEQLLKLLNTVEGIDVYINSNSRIADMPAGSAFAKTIMLNSFWQGREMGELSLEVEGSSIKSWKARRIRLTCDVPDDKKTAAILPRCFEDADCAKKGMIGQCRDKGLPGSRCQFSAATKVALTVITPKDQLPTDNSPLIEFLEKRFPGLTVSHIYYPNSAKAAQLVGELAIKSLPAYLFAKDIDKEYGFKMLKADLEPKGQYYLLSSRLSGISYFLDRPRIKGQIDVFLSLYDPNAADILANVKDFKPRVHFLPLASSRLDKTKGDPEAEEYLRSVCVERLYPGKFWDYIICRATRFNSSWWEDCIGPAAAERIKACARSQEGKALLENNLSLGRSLQISSGPVYFVNNQEIYSSGAEAPSKEELKKIFKRQ